MSAAVHFSAIVAPQLSQDRAAVHLVPGLGDEAVADAQDRGRGELDPPAGRGDAEELAAVGPGPALVGGDQVAFGEQQLDPCPRSGKAARK